MSGAAHRRVEVASSDPRFPGSPVRALSLLEKVKSVVHGRKTAYTPNAAACRACGLCVVACPEKAITLVRAETG
ncbi:MAG: 4Fe-4S binding protein [Polyangiaceae bacterium]